MQVFLNIIMFPCWFDIGRVSRKYKIPLALYKMLKQAKLVQSEFLRRVCTIDVFFVDIDKMIPGARAQKF